MSLDLFQLRNFLKFLITMVFSTSLSDRFSFRFEDVGNGSKKLFGFLWENSPSLFDIFPNRNWENPTAIDFLAFSRLSLYS